MGRRPVVFVRPVSMDEGRRLERISRTAKGPVRLRRAIVMLMSAQDQTVEDIISLIQVGGDSVRDVIHAFNERELAALVEATGHRLPPQPSPQRTPPRMSPHASKRPVHWTSASSPPPTPSAG
ncbi:hypothetical protein ACWDZ4_13410 [Streptomyces sp. NPDC003016]